ncbi:MAG: isoprenyl transferase [Chthoniobacteraceae bacterium]
MNAKSPDGKSARALTSAATTPRHIAIIMDGNGRWARKHGLPRLKGHERGAATVRAVTEECVAQGVEFLTLYAFSTENWKRPDEEVSGLWELLEQFLAQELPTMMKNGVRLRAIGRIAELPESTRRRLDETIAATANNPATTLILALNYSSRTELADAVQSLCADAAAGKLDPAAITPDTISARLYTSEYPDPDLLIRTSGEMRLSNFMLWQLSYAEFYITPKLWPDFGKQDLRTAIAEFHNRERRFGGI